MDFCPQKTFADSATFECAVVFGMSIPDDFFHRLLAAGATLHVDIQVTPGADEGATIGFLLSDVLATLCDPAGKSL
jgi:hypothetical protein